MNPSTHRRYAQVGLGGRHERCAECPVTGDCPFYLNLDGNANLKALYRDAERHDGYFRDRCVFSPDIDIEDSMHAVVNYRNGVRMTYSLNAHSPWEGYVVAMNGTRGRLEHKCEETVYINADGSGLSDLMRDTARGRAS